MSELNVPPLVLTGLPPARKTKRLDDAVLGWQPTQQLPYLAAAGTATWTPAAGERRDAFRDRG